MPSPTRGAPSAFLRAVADRLPHGRVLDVACGSGRNASFLATRGDCVVGIDRSLESLREARAAIGSERFLPVQADLERFALPESAFDVVVNTRYLQRSLAPALRRSLRPGGMLVFETFLIEQLELGHPRNPEFVLRHNELLELFRELRVLQYEEGLCDDGGVQTYLARLLAQKPEIAPRSD